MQTDAFQIFSDIVRIGQVVMQISISCGMENFNAVRASP